jgi:hypothetical protein
MISGGFSERVCLPGEIFPPVVRCFPSGLPALASLLGRAASMLSVWMARVLNVAMASA